MPVDAWFRPDSRGHGAYAGNGSVLACWCWCSFRTSCSTCGSSRARPRGSCSATSASRCSSISSSKARRSASTSARSDSSTSSGSRWRRPSCRCAIRRPVADAAPSTASRAAGRWSSRFASCSGAVSSGSSCRARSAIWTARCAWTAFAPVHTTTSRWPRACPVWNCWTLDGDPASGVYPEDLTSLRSQSYSRLPRCSTRSR